jgi:hypothetical protein
MPEVQKDRSDGMLRIVQIEPPKKSRAQIAIKVLDSQFKHPRYDTIGIMFKIGASFEAQEDTISRIESVCSPGLIAPAVREQGDMNMQQIYLLHVDSRSSAAVRKMLKWDKNIEYTYLMSGGMFYRRGDLGPSNALLRQSQPKIIQRKATDLNPLNPARKSRTASTQ